MSRYNAVITTINMPTLLADLADNARANNRAQDVRVTLIGDHKTPAGIDDYVKSLADCGIEIDYWSPARQQEWLRKYPELDAIVPWNTDNRRNLGHLMAFERGDDITITIDDDNYPAAVDYFGGFAPLGETSERELTSSDSGWFNVCSLLQASPNVTFHPRGFPVSKRFVDETLTTRKAKCRLVVQAGLWNGVPDVDASTHVTMTLETTGIPGRNRVLDQHTWCPFNTQNSAYLTEITPAFYYVSMAEPLAGQNVDRYGDIWAGYLARTVIDAYTPTDGSIDVIGFGDPLANHIRNVHDFLHDLQLETPAMQLNETLLDILLGLQLRGSDSYLDTASELAELLPSAITSALPANRAARDYLLQLADKYAIWARICQKVATQR